MRLIFISLFLCSFIISCGPFEESSVQFESPKALLESVPAVQPEKMLEFSEVDTLFLQHLAYNTIARDDGSFVLGDRGGKMILHVDSEGNLIKQVAREGRGPGEFQDMVYFTARPNGGVVFWDQINIKAVFFDSNFEFEKDVVLNTSRGEYISMVYDLGNGGNLITEGGTFNFGPNADNESATNIAFLNSDGELKANGIKLKARKDVTLGNGGMFMVLPFGDRQLINYKPKSQTFITYWTGSDTLAEVNAQFDTLNTIALNLPTEQINQAEMDSIKNEFSEYWDDLKDELPEQKTPVENMHIDEQNRIWLKLGYRSDFDQWLIVNSSGNSQKIVQLPKGTMLTHVSKHHLGVRMGPGTFALYEPVE